MKVSLGSVIYEIKKRSVQRRRFISILTVLSLLISSGVVWQLRSVGITLANDVCCGIEEHEHAESCFESELVCGIDETTETSDSDETAHVHTDECYEERLICNIPEHIHTVECCDNELAVPVQKQPEEVPVVELDSAVAGDVVESEENIESEDDEVTEDVQDADTSEEEQGSDYAVNLFPNAVMNSFMSVYALSENEVSVNTIYLKTNSGVENVPLDSEGYFVMNTGEVSSFYIKADSSVTANNYFYTIDNDGSIGSKNYSQTINSGIREAVVNVTALRPGTAMLCFDVGNDEKGHSIVSLNIKVEPDLNVMYVVNEKSEIKNNTSENSRYSMAVGDYIEICAYILKTDWNDGDNFYCAGASYHENGAVKGVAVEKDIQKTDYSDNIYRINKKYKVSEVNKFYISYKNRSGFFIDVSDPYASTRIVLNGQDPASVYNNTSPYSIIVGQSFQVEGYGVSTVENYFYCSFDVDKEQTVTMNYNNEVDTSYTAERKVTGTFTAVQPGTSVVYFGNKSFYVKVKANEEANDKIYVVSALGEREKDRIHEYLSILEPPSGSANPKPEKTDDGQYVKNTKDFPYIIYVGESVELCFYTEQGNKDYFWKSSGNDKVTVTNSEENIGSLRRNAASIVASASGDCVISHVSKSGSIDFYLRVLDSDSNKRDHADIEITDGGFYEFRNEKVDTQTGTRTVTIERYDSYITGVNHCYLYNSSKDIIATFLTEDYQSNGTIGSSQYELTSKYKCSGKAEKHYERNKVYSAKFDVSVTLKPSTKTVTVYTNGVLTSTTSTDISGGEVISLSSVVFNLNHRSVIDAHNKCPDHSGLDFNVSACLNNIITNIKFTASKYFENSSGVSVPSPGRTYTFELVDKNNNVVGTTTSDSSGNIAFNDVFLSEGEYDYTIREYIPSDAKDIDGKKYQQGSPEEPQGVFYDQNTVTYQVHITSSSGIVTSSFSKLVNGVSTAIDNFDGAFKNIVVDEKYTDLNVVKEWSDGNDKHNDQQIKFRIYRVEGSNRELVSIGGETEFYNGSNDSWKKTYSGLPVEMAGHSYSYEVEETDIPDGYIVSYSSDTETNTCKIINTLKTQVSISVKKVWTFSDGRSIDNPPVSSVSAVVKRKCKDALVSVPVTIYDKSGNQLYKFTLETYGDNNLLFELNTDTAFFEIAATNCTCEKKSGKLFEIKDVKEGAFVRLNYDIIHYDFSTGVQGWTGRGISNAESGYRSAYSTFYAGTGDGSKALAVGGRNQDWHGVFVPFTPVSGEKYSISGYFKSDAGVNVAIGLEYEINGTKNYKIIASNIVDSNWNHIYNSSFEVENGGSGYKIYIQTIGSTNLFFVDEFSIAPAGVNISVTNTGAINTDKPNISYTDKTSTLNVNSTNWIDDVWSYNVELLNSDNWLKTLDYDALGESPNRIYQYYVEEVSVPGFTTNYLCTNVSANTPDSPIIIQNKAIQYTLPPTGGSGTEKYKTAGLILIFVASAAFIIKRKKFDIKKG